MGLFNGKGSEKRVKERQEREAFRQIVAKKTKEAERQSFIKEAVEVAKERAKAKARRQTLGEIVSERARKFVEGKAAGTTTRAPPVRRTTTRAPPLTLQSIYGN